MLLIVLAAPMLGFVQAAQEEGYVRSSGIWPSFNINVCWENPEDAPANERDWVEQAVANTWEANSKVDFVGWGACETNTRGIRILAEDSGPHVKALGNRLDGMTDGMVLNFTFRNWSTSCANSQNQRRACIENIAVHEFGHALAFAHEQNRPDTPESCQDAPQGSNGDILVGSWDLDSVMIYCNPIWSNNGRLSKGDIATVQAYYTWENIWERVGGATTSNLSCDSSGDSIHCAYRGLDNALYHRYWDGQQWHRIAVGGGLTSDPSCTIIGRSHFHCAYRGNDKALYHRYYDGNNWHRIVVGGGLKSSPSCASLNSSHFGCVYRGNDNAFYYRHFDGSAWHRTRVGGSLTSNPSCVAIGNQFHCAYRGLDQGLYHRYFDSRQWHRVPVGGILTSNPSCTSSGSGRFDCFYRGKDQGLYHRWWDGSKWDRQPLGGTLSSDPDCVSWGSGRLDCFYRGTNNTLMHRWHDGSEWRSESLGGKLDSRPECSTSGPGRIDCFVRGDAKAIFRKWLP